MKIGLFYGSTTCYTEMTAEKIQQFIGEDIVDIYNIKDVALSNCLNYEYIIFGISTWDFGELQEDWESIWSDVAELDLTGKTIALYGQGDQEDYGEWFQDALGMLYQAIIHNDCNIIGFWPNQGYEFIASKALTEDKNHFVGLSLDDERQFDLSQQRIEDWCVQILQQIAE
ncbi:flavodoxin FldB [Catenovulum agarivorans DS-2]|uniref:Flavodoxin n=1 Tax=Catenovulum agarivorans DS-2 TaxID=1328313 RepID=W7QH43_9ALTE|nr:flavodoxin FldB [Catenovulum agarivorans]EWH12259.1 flavodoxin FldB [Catenovulum agarivorans DS-2]